MPDNILIIGATSAIAHATARLYAPLKARFFLVGRDEHKLKANQQDLQVLGAGKVDIFTADLCDFDAHETLLSKAQEALGSFDIALIAHGSLPDQDAVIAHYDECERALKINFLSYVSLLTRLANTFEKAHSGTIAVISSVAGDRGRQSNYVYGSAKAGVSVFTEGLRNRLFHQGVHVLTIKPGFVDTPMTSALKKGPLFASPEFVAYGIKEAIAKRKNVVYLPWFWRMVMTIICSIPECIFKRLKL